jgi:hypothetical protein
MAYAVSIYGYSIMTEMTKKTTILFPPKLYEDLERVAKEQGRSVGELVRDATEIQYGVGGVAARLRAVELMSKLETPIAEPEELEEQISKGAREEQQESSET